MVSILCSAKKKASLQLTGSSGAPFQVTPFIKWKIVPKNKLNTKIVKIGSQPISSVYYLRKKTLDRGNDILRELESNLEMFDIRIK